MLFRPSEEESTFSDNITKWKIEREAQQPDELKYNKLRHIAYIKPSKNTFSFGHLKLSLKLNRNFNTSNFDNVWTIPLFEVFETQ